MLMRKEMILTVLIVSVTFGTESELQARVIQFRPAAYRTAVVCAVRISHMGSGLLFEFCLPRLLLWTESFKILRRSRQEKDNKIQK